MARVFNAIATMGICASLAMLGWEVQEQRPSETHYDFSVVMPPPDPDSDEDDADAPPPKLGDHRSGHDNDDKDRRPIAPIDPGAPIPI
jgi:hypothetical protein